MSPEMIAALFGLGGTVLGALIGAGVSVWVTKSQLLASLKQQKLEVINTQMTRLQTVLQQISERSADVGAEDISHEKILSALTDMFIQRAGLFLGVSYLFPKDFEEKVITVLGQVNKFIYRAKTGQAINENDAKECVEDMQILDKEIFILFREKLRSLNSAFEQLTEELR